MLESRPVGHVFNRIKRLDIYVQSTDFNVSNFFFPEKPVGMKSPQRCAGISLQPLRVFIYGLDLEVCGDREEFNSSWLIYKETECILNMFVSFLFINKDHWGRKNQQI